METNFNPIIVLALDLQSKQCGPTWCNNLHRTNLVNVSRMRRTACRQLVKHRLEDQQLSNTKDRRRKPFSLYDRKVMLLLMRYANVGTQKVLTVVHPSNLTTTRSYENHTMGIAAQANALVQNSNGVVGLPQRKQPIMAMIYFLLARPEFKRF